MDPVITAGKAMELSDSLLSQGHVALSILIPVLALSVAGNIALIRMLREAWKDQIDAVRLGSEALHGVRAEIEGLREQLRSLR